MVDGVDHRYIRRSWGRDGLLAATHLCMVAMADGTASIETLLNSPSVVISPVAPARASISCA